MNYLWSVDDLLRLCRHKSPEVRLWAVDRLSFLYPAPAGVVALELLNDPDEPVALAAARHFSLHPEARYKDALLSSYKKSHGPVAGKVARALSGPANPDLQDLITAFKEKYGSDYKEDVAGYALSVLSIASTRTDTAREIVESALTNVLSGEYEFEIIGTLFVSNLIAGTSMERLLRLCCERPDSRELLIELLVQIDRYCGSWYTKEDFEEEEEKGELPYIIGESLDGLEDLGYGKAGKELESLFREKRYGEVVEKIFSEAYLLLEEKRRTLGEEAVLVWQGGIGKPRQNFAALTAFRNFFGGAPEATGDLLAQAALSVFTRLVECGDLIGVIIEGMDPEHALSVFLQDRGDVEEDERLMEILSEKEEFVNRGVQHLLEAPDTWAGPRIVRLIGKAEDADAFARLFGIDPDYRDLWDEIALTASVVGPQIVPLLKPFFESFDMERIPYALRILENVPVIESVELISVYWENLWELDKEGLLEAVENIADRKFADLLKKELKKGEIGEARAFYFLCQVHALDDPRCKEAEKTIQKHDRKLEQRLHALKSADVETLMKEPVELELKCRRCHKAYHYRVEEIGINADKLSEHFIIDTIKCKSCGSVDNYEITQKASLTISSHLMLLMMRPGKRLPEGGTFTLFHAAPIDGRQMSFSEGAAYYAERVAGNPDNPELLIGYANTLRKVKRTDEAISHYEMAIAVDPLAIEAYVSLGQIAEEGGDDRAAYEYFKKASDILSAGHFYRVRQDLDQFKEAVLNSLVHLGKKLGIKPVSREEMPFVVRHPKVGRNEPCPCGSGKKYKKCCLEKEPGSKAPTSTVQPLHSRDHVLAEKLIAYSHKERFRKDFARAVAIYWRTEPVEPLVLPERAAEDQGEFIEWYINDYLLSSGKTIIEEYYSEMFPALTVEEREMLEARMMSAPGIYEVVDVDEGVGLKIKDIFTDREAEVKEVKGSQQLVKWDVIMARLSTVQGITVFLSPSIFVIPRELKDGLMDFLQREFEGFKEEAGKNEWSAFMKRRPYLVIHYMEDLSGQKLIYLTEERHLAASARASFRINDFDETLDLLENEYDFVIDKVSGKEAKLSWLKRGKSKEWQESREERKEGIILQSKLIHESGKMEWAVLGTITVTRGRLALECLSKERLERGKSRIMEILKNIASHESDTFESIEEMMERAPAPKRTEKRPAPSGYAQSLMEAQMSRYIMEWLDAKIPALDGMSPREAVRTTQGRNKVIELLKYFENAEERKRRQGEPYLDIGLIRRELGLD